MSLSRSIVRPLLLSLSIAPAIASAGIVGFLGNFDVVNDTGKTAYGFEIELEGLHKSDITDVFGGPGRGFPTGRGYDHLTSVERYGAPSIDEYTNGAVFGTRVTYFATFANGAWDYTTPSTQAVGHFVTPGESCWSGGGSSYGANTPCDHFGVGAKANATKTTYSWLYGDASGNLTNAGGAVSLPAPVWAVAPPVAAGQPPAQVVAQIKAPAPIQPPEQPEPQWGEAIWVKVFTTELEKPVGLEELVAGNAKVEKAVTETEWQLLQKDPGNLKSGQLESGYGAPVGPNAASILRRYEFYAFGGFYDPTDHHAILTGNDSHPEGTDLGNYLGAQNAAVNLNVPAIPAVPEPESYAMLVAGLAVIVVVSRYKKLLSAAS